MDGSESGRVLARLASLVQSGRDLGVLDEPRGLDSRRVWASLSGSGLFWASLDDLGRESMRVQPAGSIPTVILCEFGVSVASQARLTLEIHFSGQESVMEPLLLERHCRGALHLGA